MNFLNFAFTYRAETPARLSAWKGSMLRGALGTNLRRGLCMIRKENNCANCMLGQNCVFPKIFNPFSQNDKSRPVPFCLETNQDEKMDYQEGELLQFNLKLFSYGVEYLPFFVHAFRLSGEKGLGSSRLPGKFILEEVRHNNANIFDREKDKLHIPTPSELPEPRIIENMNNGEVVVQLQSPLRFKSGNRFSNRLEFSDLINLILRRIKALTLLEEEDWKLDKEKFSFLQDAAKQVKIAQNNLSWLD